MQADTRLARIYGAIFRGAVFGVILLVAQNLMGMQMNLWVDLSRYSSAPKAFASVGMLDAHVAVGLIILAGTLTLMILGFRSRNPSLRIPGLLAFVFALLAFSSGLQFVFGGENDVFSFTMELGFVGVFGSVATVLYLVGKSRANREK